jgi:hypothetical protein
MALQTDAVEGSVGALERADEVEHRCQLPALVFDVVIVDIELRIRISRTSGLEGKGDVVFPEDVVEDVRAPGTVVIAVNSKIRIEDHMSLALFLALTMAR